MADIEQIKKATRKMKETVMAPVKGVEQVIVYRDGVEMERIAPASVYEFGKGIDAGKEVIDTLISHPWCNHNGFSFKKVGGE